MKGPARRRARWAWFVLLALWCAATWKLSSESDPEDYVGVELGLPDKVEHGIEYAVGGFLAAGAVASVRRARPFAAAVIFCVAWGVLDEYHQSFVPGRDSTGWDVAADGVGAALGALGSAWWSRRREAAGRGDDESGELTHERRPT